MPLGFIYWQFTPMEGSLTILDTLLLSSYLCLFWTRPFANSDSGSTVSFTAPSGEGQVGWNEHILCPPVLETAKPFEKFQLGLSNTHHHFVTKWTGHHRERDTGNWCGLHTNYPRDLALTLTRKWQLCHSKPVPAAWGRSYFLFMFNISVCVVYACMNTDLHVSAWTSGGQC